MSDDEYEIEEDEHHSLTRRVLTDCSTLMKPWYLDDHVMLAIKFVNGSEDPETFKAAMNSKESTK